MKQEELPEDEVRRMDEVLRRMLNTPPKPHSKKKTQKKAKERSAKRVN